ncbi:MAG: hypothetical protein ACOC6D_05965 [Atribacterota bacterium]
MCYNLACFQEAVKKNRIGKALKTDLSAVIIKELEEKLSEINNK